MAKRSFRTRIKLRNGKSAFAIRDKKGRFKDIQNIGRSLKADRRVQAKTIVKSGQGFRGDSKRRKKPTSLEIVPRIFDRPAPSKKVFDTKVRSPTSVDLFGRVFKRRR